MDVTSLINRLFSFIDRLLCELGAHDFRVIGGTMGFGAAGDVEKVECRRCGLIKTRRM